VLVGSDQLEFDLRMKEQNAKQFASSVTRPSNYSCLNQFTFPFVFAPLRYT
jgi:hypothetical protein